MLLPNAEKYFYQDYLYNIITRTCLSECAICMNDLTESNQYFIMAVSIMVARGYSSYTVLDEINSLHAVFVFAGRIFGPFTAYSVLKNNNLQNDTSYDYAVIQFFKSAEGKKPLGSPTS